MQSKTRECNDTIFKKDYKENKKKGYMRGLVAYIIKRREKDN